MPTYANFNVGGAIGVGDTSPSTMLDRDIANGRLSRSRLIVGLNVGWRAAKVIPSLHDRVGAYADLREL
ncbi:hypothetical protein BZG13_14775 [Salinivibrio sp. ML323]|nr:hypothetical protein BZG13_14775 [Salinivibrio sp. ML323]